MRHAVVLKRVLIPLFSLIIFGHLSFAQRADTVKLYYHINESSANRQLTRLDSLLNADKDNITQICITGYADYIGSADYNMALSKTRANNVKEYLSGKMPGLPVSSTGKGRQQGITSANVIGAPFDRRVDVILTKKNVLIAARVQENPASKIPSINPSDSVKKATVEEKINALAVMKPGESVDMEEFLFQPGRHYPMPESEKYITTLFNILKKDKKLKVQIIGHICCDYSSKDGFDNDTRDFTLSLNRAKFIYVSLLGLGIPDSRMKYAGMGSTKPKVYPEVTDNDKALNRRVEILILSN